MNAAGMHPVPYKRGAWAVNLAAREMYMCIYGLFIPLWEPRRNRTFLVLSI